MVLFEAGALFVLGAAYSFFSSVSNSNAAENIISQYIDNIDYEIENNILSLYNMKKNEKLLDDTFIFSQVETDLRQHETKIDETFVDELYSNIEKSFQISKVSCLVIGDIGVGKTTIINELLKLPKNKKGETKTISGESVTKGPPIRYNNPNYLPWLVLFDTQGFDKSIRFADSINGMREYIENKFSFKNNGDNEFVNIIIYCINGERLIETEKKNIIELHNLYPSKKLQIIVLHTRGLSENADILLNKIKLDLERNYNINDILFLSVSAIDSKYLKSKENKFEKFDSFNMDKLLYYISNICWKSLESSLYKFFLEQIKDLQKSKVNNIINNIESTKLYNIKFGDIYKEILEESKGITVENERINSINNYFKKIMESPDIEKVIVKKIKEIKSEYF